jgi:hypothetical protein
MRRWRCVLWGGVACPPLPFSIRAVRRGLASPDAFAWLSQASLASVASCCTWSRPGASHHHLVVSMAAPSCGFAAPLINLSIHKYKSLLSIQSYNNTLYIQ